MPGLSLRKTECVLCGTAIQNAGRMDRIYCSASCRTLAWRTRSGRRPQQQARSAGASIPRIDDVALLVSQIEAVLRAVRADAPEAEARQTMVAETPPEHSNSALAAELESVRAELASERELHARREADLEEDNARLNAELADQKRSIEATEKANAEKEETIQQMQRQLAQAQARHESSNDHARRIRELAVQNEALRREVQRLCAAKQNLEQAALQLEDSDAAQRRRIEQLENEGKAAVARISQLRARLDQAKEQTAKADPLRFLMERKVKLLHDIAITSDRIAVNVPGQRLPDDSPKTFQAAVDYALHEARQTFYASAVRCYSEVAWIKTGGLLDPASEEKLRSRQEQAVQSLEFALSLARQKLR